MKFDNPSIATSFSSETNVGVDEDQQKRRSDSADLDVERSSKRSKTSSAPTDSSPLKLQGPFPGYRPSASSLNPSSYYSFPSKYGS
mmetsp:Transcript_4008/g.6310  ORF Transcript_4008/g.6310 Transcript_4008/m.6310 type:complete len:86 (+) Transcript_4008:102-359(+)